MLYVVLEKGETDFSRLMKDIMKTKQISMSMIIYYWTEMLSCVKDIHEKGYTSLFIYYLSLSAVSYLKNVSECDNDIFLGGM